jgi:4-carboxymuconolactone decarboxylase
MRLPTIDKTKLSPEAQTVWDRILAGRSSAAMRGPSAALMHVPSLADRVFTLEEYFRGPECELSATDRELIILATAREAGAKFAWARHEARGNEVGVRKEAIEALRANGPLDSLSPHERLLVELARSILRTKEIPQDLYDRALKELGQRQLIEVNTLIGTYSLIGMTIKAFDITEDSPTF